MGDGGATGYFGEGTKIQMAKCMTVWITDGMYWVLGEHLGCMRDEVQEKQSLGISLSNSYKLDIAKVNWICNS